MPRQVKPSGGRRFSMTCTLLGREAEGRKAVIKRGRNNVRIATIGPDGLTTDEIDKVPASVVQDLQTIADPTATSQLPITAVVSERGAVTLPSSSRRRYRLPAGSLVVVEERDDGILLKPAEVIPRRVAPGSVLDGLLESVTPENVHEEIDLGPEADAQGE